MSISIFAVNPKLGESSQAAPIMVEKFNPQPETVQKTFSDNPVPKHKKQFLSPGNIPSFWWSFILSAIGAYTIYAIGIGPISVLVVYFASKKNKIEVRKATWGWITGTLLGIGVWAATKLL
jgi:hypothetical protein